MPAKPLNEEQKADAARLRELVRRRKDADASLTQENIAHACDMSQGAVHQYLSGKIPLNLAALLKFARLLKAHPKEISPALTEELEIGLHLAASAPAAGAGMEQAQVDAMMARLAELVVLFGKADEDGQMAVLNMARAMAHMNTSGSGAARNQS